MAPNSDYFKTFGEPLAESTAVALDNADENKSFRHEFRIPTRAQLRGASIVNAGMKIEIWKAREALD
jgi:hypothetical protein